MSEIHDPAQPKSPDAPDDAGSESMAKGNEAAEVAREPVAEDDDNIGNRIDAPAHAAHAADASDEGADEQGPTADEEESPEDSIGNRIDGPPTHLNTSSGAALGGAGKKKRRRRKGEKGERPQGEGAAAQGAHGRPHTHHASAEPARRPFHVGDKVRAKIITVGPAALMVDLWGKEQGVLDLREMQVEGEAEPQVGDQVDVVVVQDGSRGGNVVVTRDPQRGERAKELVTAAFNDNSVIEGLVTGVNRGGLEIDLSGMRAFCPSSQIDVRFPPSVNPKSMILSRLTFKVTSLIEDGREAIVSRRAIVEQEVRARAEEAKANIKIGSVVKGTVVAVKEYGVFVDLGGIEGMIHISELSHNRAARPADVVKVGDEVEAKVLRITGGHKPEPAPASTATEAPPETHAEAHAEAHEANPSEAPTVEAPAATEGGEEGEAHAAEGEEGPEIEMGAEGHDEHAHAEAAPAEGAKHDGKKGKKGGKKKPMRTELSLPRVILSRRAVEPDPWSGIEKKFPVGSVHQGRVARMQPFGAFIELLPGVDGLLHVSELGESKRIEHPNEVLKDGQTVNVRVERVDKGAHRIALSLLPEGVTEEQLKTAVMPRVGMITKAKIIEHESVGGMWAQIVGAIGKFGRGHIAPQDSNQPRGTDLRRMFPIGTEVQVKVLEMDRGRPKLSIKAALQDEERAAYRQYQREATSKAVGVSLADKLRAKFGDLAGGGSKS